MKLTIAMLAMSALAMAQQAEKGRSEPTGKQTMTGCLTKGSDQPQHYTFVDQGTGKKWTVTGPADLEKHSANHTVEITGTPTAKVFNVTGVKHISPTCEAKSSPVK